MPIRHALSTALAAAAVLVLAPACKKAPPPAKPAPPKPAPAAKPKAVDKPGKPDKPKEPSTAASGVGVVATKPPLGLFELPATPEGNPLTQAKVELGKLLYFDGRLSKDGSVSCATCHDPKKGWADGAAVSTGIGGAKGGVSAPTVINSAYMRLQFWDGRAPDLEAQAAGPIENPIEMGNTHEGAVKTLAGIAGYGALFEAAFGDRAITIERITQAIASFERTVLGGNSRFDRYQAGDKAALNPEEDRGRALFFGKANCTKCHVGGNFSDGLFHNLGVGWNTAAPAKSDMGRFAVTKKKEDKGAFKTPTVRDITRTAPYMHDGSEATLEAVVEFYDRGGNENPHLDKFMKPLGLNAEEKAALVAFMKALDSDPYPDIAPPTAFPQ